MKKITSVQNTIIKDLLKLQAKSRERTKKKLFLIEGKREISLANNSNYKIEQLFFCTDFISESEVVNLVDSLSELIAISKEIYQKLAYRSSTEGVIAVARTNPFSLNTIRFITKTPLVLVAESIEKPGNLGAILRTADAAAIDAVLIANPSTDLYNQNIIRSSLGCLFTNQIAIASSEDIAQFLNQHQIYSYAMTLQNSNSYLKEDFKKATAIIVGSEANGLSDFWKENSTKNINIPMLGAIDSMNVSVAAAISIFEAKRQRSI